MSEPEKFSEAMRGFRQAADDVARGSEADVAGDIGGRPPTPPPLDPPGGGSNNPGMEPITALNARVGKVEEALHGLRQGQNILLGVLAGGLALILTINIYIAEGAGDQLRDMNARFDRFLERQADAASAANARFDRLLEQRAQQPQAPIVIQIPAPSPPAQAPTPAPASPPPG